MSNTATGAAQQREQHSDGSSGNSTATGATVAGLSVSQPLIFSPSSGISGSHPLILNHISRNSNNQLGLGLLTDGVKGNSYHSQCKTYRHIPQYTDTPPVKSIPTHSTIYRHMSQATHHTHDEKHTDTFHNIPTYSTIHRHIQQYTDTLTM